MLDNKQKCCAGLKSDGGCIVPHHPYLTETVQCDLPVVAMEHYRDEDGCALPVCEKHRHLVQAVYADIKASEAQRAAKVAADSSL